MARADDLFYRFGAASHWEAGALDCFEAGAGGLAVAPTLAAERIAESEPGAIAALGPCGRLVWLRTRSGELFTLHEFGAEPQGRIRVRRPRAIHPGPSILWVRSRQRLDRYAARTLQWLGETRIEGLAGSAPDGCDGLWLLIRGAQGAAVRRLGAGGLFEGPPIALRDARDPLAIASDPARRRLAVLDAPAEGEAVAQWRLHIVDLAECEARAPYRFALASGLPPPRWLAFDLRGGIHLASATSPIQLTGVSEAGVETSGQALPLADCGAVNGLIWGDGGPILDCDGGLYRLRAASAEDEGAATATAAFITPTLMSPPGTPGGWNRAEIAVDLPRGAILTATVFASSSAALAREVEEALAATATSPAARRADVEALLTGHNARLVRKQSYRGAGAQLLHLLLDRIAEPYLWLKLEIVCPAGAGAASIGSLKVRYPDRSWLDELPAIYRDAPGPAAQLRQFLAPFESLYTGLDETIDRLPARIDPGTASDDRLGWLLGWLGFPPTAGLEPDVQRELLRAAGRLLASRGTLEALREMLDIVTEGRAEVEDSGGRPDFWVVGAGPARLAPRLGLGTRIVSSLPSGFRPGRGLRLGEEPLPPFCTDVGRTLGARCALVTIRIVVAAHRRAILLPIIDSMLAMFVPAHCAVDLRIAPAGRTRPGGRLDRRWRLADGDSPQDDAAGRLADPDATELGCETEAGAWQLPSPQPPPFPIDGNAALDGPHRLA